MSGTIDTQNRSFSGYDIASRIMPIGNQYAFGLVLPANGTNLVPILAGSPGYFLTNVALQVDPICTIAVAGMVNLTLVDSSFGVVAGTRWYIPASITGGPTLPSNNLIQTDSGFAWNNQIANSTLSAKLDVALTAGSVRFSCRYANVTFLG